MTTIETVNKSQPIDYEICELLGEKPTDFLVIYANGKPADFLGTPIHKPSTQVHWEQVIELLNGEKDEDYWSKLFVCHLPDWYKLLDLPKGTSSIDCRPFFSLRIHRVCAGYSEHSSAACALLERLSERCEFWEVTKAHYGYRCRMMGKKWKYPVEEIHGTLSETIAAAAHRFLTIANTLEPALR